MVFESISIAGSGMCSTGHHVMAWVYVIELGKDLKIEQLLDHISWEVVGKWKCFAPTNVPLLR